MRTDTPTMRDPIHQRGGSCPGVHRRRFLADMGLGFTGLAIENITRRTLPPDFAGNPRIHNAWRVHRARGAG